MIDFLEIVGPAKHFRNTLIYADLTLLLDFA
jgi:hypothetical protein